MYLGRLKDHPNYYGITWLTQGPALLLWGGRLVHTFILIYYILIYPGSLGLLSPLASGHHSFGQLSFLLINLYSCDFGFAVAEMLMVVKC